ncbi:uracil-DNA glycosylase-like protein [Mucor mucedo]|uniref:uracil-DNA glycosylase-like protein n=1 Tax=Mucor mucedo TaxID=29922 RepID=UPI00221EEF8F|nr:uracil-DNA glycosylase-like protein [Mucor mucedo]KAI7873569.1 uracil-DNA glycosylase-like protein [Mucor mucedo]
MNIPANCNILFVGINPSAANPQADYFETPNNQFYRLINESAVTGEIQVNRASELRLINAGVMNFVDRATQMEKEINNDEMAAGKYRLQIAVQKFHPRVICFVGTKCCKYTLYVPRTNNNVNFGLQPRNFEGVPVFCVPHGSNKGINLTFNDKLM